MAAYSGAEQGDRRGFACGTDAHTFFDRQRFVAAGVEKYGGEADVAGGDGMGVDCRGDFVGDFGVDPVRRGPPS